MSRHGYSDDLNDDLALGRWRGMVASSIRGRRGQQFLKELLAALDAMPKKELIGEDLERGGEVCALGALALKRGLDVEFLDTDDWPNVAAHFHIAECLAREVMFENDEGGRGWVIETPQHRWRRMRVWTFSQIKNEQVTNSKE